MTALELKRIAWWEKLSNQWQDLIIRNLGLEGFFELEDLCYLETLDELDCSGVNLRSLDPLLFFPNLKKLSLCDTRIRNGQALKSLKQLDSLDMSFCSQVDLRLLNSLPNLKTLDISYVDSGLLYPELLPEMKQLNCLIATACKNLPLLKLAKIPKLKYVSMEFCYLGKAELEMFKALRPQCVLKI
ncbi:MAG: hypothetical protein AAF696_09385 [Bacteroidota bacterium]